MEIWVLNDSEIYFIISFAGNICNHFFMIVVNFQFNYSSGQPAPETITDKIYGNTLSVSDY